MTDGACPRKETCIVTTYLKCLLLCLATLPPFLRDNPSYYRVLILVYPTSGNWYSQSKLKELWTIASRATERITGVLSKQGSCFNSVMSLHSLVHVDCLKFGSRTSNDIF